MYVGGFRSTGFLRSRFDMRCKTNINVYLLHKKKGTGDEGDQILIPPFIRDIRVILGSLALPWE